MVPLAPLPLYRAISDCTAINTLEYIGHKHSRIHVIAMLRNTSALKRLKLPGLSLSNIAYEDLINSFLASRMQLYVLELGFSRQAELNSSLSCYWPLAQHIPGHPLFSVISLHLHTSSHFLAPLGFRTVQPLCLTCLQI